MLLYWLEHNMPLSSCGDRGILLYDSAKIYLYLFASSFTISSQESMRFIKLAIEFYKNAYSDSSQNALGAYIQQYNVNMYEKILKEYMGVEKLTTELEVAVKFFCYGRK